MLPHTRINFFMSYQLTAGTKLSTVYNSVKEFLSKSKYPTLGDKLTKSIGFAMGIDFRESSLLISPKARVEPRSFLKQEYRGGFL